MRRRHEMIPSQSMGRRVHVWCYGHWGAPLVVFPTAAGFAHEWEAQGMIEALQDFIQGGKLKIYCPESNISETWTNKQHDLGHKAARHRAYEEFILGDLVPWIRADCAAPPELRVAATGASLGGYYAANFALKYPETFYYALCMSGRYDLAEFTGGQQSQDVYFNNPMAFVPNLSGPALERVQRGTHIGLVCGQGPWEEGCIEETQRLADLLQARGIPHDRDIWGHDVSHNWVWWERQARLHLGRRFG